MTNLYVVIMYRYGNQESYSYLLGVYDGIFNAIVESYKEWDRRGNKYFPQILEVPLNATKSRRIILGLENPDEWANLVSSIRCFIGSFERGGKTV